MQEFYDITVAGVKRSLPVVPINENMSIAGFVIFGDTDVVEPCARALAEKLPPETEVLVTAEAKSIPLIYEMAKVMKMPRYVIARKSVKGYMRNPIITTVNSITNMGKEQILVVDEHDAEFIKGKKVAIIDDVISTGSSIEAIEKLVKEAEAHAADDKKKQDLISARNQADGLIYGTEKSIKDLGDKLDAALKSDIEGKIASLKTLMEGEDVEAIKKATEELAQASHKLAEQLYSQAQGQQPGADAAGAAGAQPGAGAAGGKKADDDVIDADFTESK